MICREQRGELLRDARKDVPQLRQLMGLCKLAHDAHKLRRNVVLYQVLAPGTTKV